MPTIGVAVAGGTVFVGVKVGSGVDVRVGVGVQVGVRVGVEAGGDVGDRVGVQVGVDVRVRVGVGGTGVRVAVGADCVTFHWMWRTLPTTSSPTYRSLPLRSNELMLPKVACAALPPSPLPKAKPVPATVLMNPVVGSTQRTRGACGSPM